MKNRLSYTALLGALALVGCPTPVTPTCGMGLVCPDDTGGRDSGTPTDSGPPGDAGMRTDAGPVSCNSSGRVGAHCRDSMCSTGLACGQLMSGMTVQQLFEVRQGTLDDPMHPGYQGLEEPALPANSSPFNGLAGGVCIQVCDSAAATDGCGTCATCSNLLTQNPFVNTILGAYGIIATADRAYGTDSAICRLDCAYDPATRGAECPSDMTCDAFSGVCVEECTTDSECNQVYGATYSGELVTIVNTENPLTCNRTTGRCEQAGRAGANVGDACDSGADCADGTGRCLTGGMCAELGCDTLNCGTGGVGLCLGINDHSTLCLAGCNTTADCEPGNACSPLTAPMGGFNGYCIGVCGDDSECRATETCTDYVDDMGEPQNGQCVDRCSTIDAIGMAPCDADEYCRRDHDGATYGYCRPLGAFCSVDMGATMGASADCGAMQICDELLATGGGTGFGNRDIFGDGHCVNRCTATADCAGRPGSTCVTTGPLTGLCRTPCTTTCTSTNEMCDATLGFCVEIPPPA